ncbi:hypothetical protein D7W82_07065 [Corallococcus sp. CA049B]|nr:hypothetical protein D7W82_07065 [Corallococcus sp. CA049B]
MGRTGDALECRLGADGLVFRSISSPGAPRLREAAVYGFVVTLSSGLPISPPPRMSPGAAGMDYGV